MPLPKNLSRRLRAVLVLGILLYLGIALYANVDEIERALRSMPLWVVPAALALAFFNYCVRFLKWQRYLKLLDVQIAVGPSFLIYLSGMSMSVTPGKMGEVFKSFLLKQVTGTAVHRTAPIVVAERFTDLLGYLILVAIGGLSAYPEYAGVFWSTLALSIVGLLLSGSQRFARLIYKLFSNLPYVWRLAPRIEGSFESTRLLLAPREILFPTLVSVVGWGAECLAFWLIADSLVPGSVPILFAIFTFAISAVAGALAIIAPGGLGVTEYLLGNLLGRRYEAALAPQLGLSGAALEKVAIATAAGALIVARLCTLWFAVVVGLIALSLFTRRYGAPEEDEDQPLDEPPGAGASGLTPEARPDPASFESAGPSTTAG